MIASDFRGSQVGKTPYHWVRKKEAARPKPALLAVTFGGIKNKKIKKSEGPDFRGCRVCKTRTTGTEKKERKLDQNHHYT